MANATNSILKISLPHRGHRNLVVLVVGIILGLFAYDLWTPDEPCSAKRAQAAESLNYFPAHGTKLVPLTVFKLFLINYALGETFLENIE